MSNNKMPKIAEYGSWQSPITSEMIAAGSMRLGNIHIDNDILYWTENRPSEGGRFTIMRWTSGAEMEMLTPAPFNVRTRAHEYGGNAFTVRHGHIFFVNDTDRQIYHIAPGSTPEMISNDKAQAYADLYWDAARDRLVMVRETHFEDDREPEDQIVALQMNSTGKAETLISGNDFYSNPVLSPDGNKLAWITWHHPNMPWNATELWIADLDAAGLPVSPRKIAGGDDISVFQPQWGADGALCFVSDQENGWWQIYRWRDNEIEQITDLAAEFGLPQWVFGMSTYALQDANTLLCTFTKNGSWQLASVDLHKRTLETVELPYTDITQVRASGNSAAFLGATATSPEGVIAYNPVTKNWETLRKSTEAAIGDGFISRAKPISFLSGGAQEAFGFFYHPQNENYLAPAGSRPPLIVMCHGGPTGATSSAFRFKIQYWTSRGFAVLDLNYRGSTGYGREYRNLLDGKWGIADVEDCINGASFLVDQKMVNPEQLAITGGSAGGFTVLAALTFFDTFRAGASYYGISDLEALSLDTHKFESRYNDRMVAPYPARKDIYKERSPIHSTDKLSRPIIFFQGLEDKIVPPAQAENMVNALREKKLPVAYITFPEEGHGFRKAENIKKALDCELYFYAKIFGLALPEGIEIPQIENLNA